MSEPILSHSILPAGSADPQSSALLVHGILASGANLKGFGRRLGEAFPDWQFVLCDLRGHGDSPTPAAPHTLSACAEDLAALARQLQPAVSMVIGHSFGGKVSLTYAAQAPSSLKQVWILDAPPGPRHRAQSDPMEKSAADVIVALRNVALPLRSRKALIDRLLELGLTRQIALWMTTNLREADGGWTWRFDLDAVEQMLASYLETDLWPVLEHAPPGVRFDLVRAERSDGWQPSDLERLERLERQSGGRIRHHLLRDSGHWVHVDNPDGLYELLAPSLQSAEDRS